MGKMCPKSHRNSYRGAGTKKDRNTIRSVLKQKGRLLRGTIPKLSMESGISVETLHGWRNSYLHPVLGLTFDPFQRRQHPPRALTKECEDQIHRVINELEFYTGGTDRTMAAA